MAPIEVPPNLKTDGGIMPENHEVEAILAGLSFPCRLNAAA